MEIDCDIKKEVVDKIVRELLEADEGKKMMKKDVGWKKLAEEAASPLGSSSSNVKILVSEVLLSEG